VRTRGGRGARLRPCRWMCPARNRRGVLRALDALRRKTLDVSERDRDGHRNKQWPTYLPIQNREKMRSSRSLV
jgi:hypothetical protein